MTDNEIIKVLEKEADFDCGMCSNNGENCLCEDCASVISRVALDLINHQKEKIEELEKGELSKAMTFNSDTIKRCSAEAIRGFVKRLKANFAESQNTGHEEFPASFICDVIDEACEEMTEATDETPH